MHSRKCTVSGETVLWFSIVNFTADTTLRVEYCVGFSRKFSAALVRALVRHRRRFFHRILYYNDDYTLWNAVWQLIVGLMQWAPPLGAMCLATD